MKLVSVNLSLKKYLAGIGVNRGISEIIMDASVGEILLTPKLSPMKYKNGSKNPSKRNHFKCFRRRGCNLPAATDNPISTGMAITSRITMTDIGR
jgi:hypothetical protein